MKKVYKKVVQDNGTITFYGGKKAMLQWGVNKDTKEYEQCFTHYGYKYFLSEFMWIGSHAPDYMKEFDGYMNDSFFSGVVIKILDDEDCVRACTFIS